VTELVHYQTILEHLRPLVENANDSRVRILDAIAWNRSVEERFFSKNATELPVVEYDQDHDGLEDRIALLQSTLTKIDGDEPVAVWARANIQSMIDACRLVLAMGTTEFYRLSRDIYGGARTRFRGTSLRNIDLANHLRERLTAHGWDEKRTSEEVMLSDQQLAVELREKLQRNDPYMKVEIVIDEHVTAKVIAGMTRVRIRKGAEFRLWEAEGLWHHEVLTHALTAHNGALQKEVPFLRAGGPRTTRTQEGLAVFSELFNHTLAAPRMDRLAQRVVLVEMAEAGADFLDLYRHLLHEGSEARDAYLDAQRVCRGGKVEGGAPFTKDASYLAGLLDVQAFLSAVVREGFRDEIELLVAGRIDLDDMHALVLLRRSGILERPRFVPPWLQHWNTLVPEFAFASFVSSLGLHENETDYKPLIDEANGQLPPSA
jgi:uncharacterized protein (TIGR02421 family)